jgi:hypothetical protein
LDKAEAHNRRIASTWQNREAEDETLAVMEAEIEQLRATLRAKTAEVLALQERIDNRADIPNAINTDLMKAEIASAQNIDHQIRQFDLHATHKNQADTTQAEIRRLDGVIEDLDDARNLAIRNAALPVEGLGFGTDDVTIDNLPFEQASSSMQLTTATAITMALRPTLKIILLRQAPLLDEEHMILLAGIAEERGYQLWCERLAPEVLSGVRIEDGEVVAENHRLEHA